ncbi:MAG: DUF3800 domain-containing protein [Gammaproteobacteria bacterium]|nr:DUF3800 domain-containing protein [Gammaproteobacteria bacterium]
MLVLIDKSGCPGFKLIQNSTPYLVIGMVIFKEFVEAEKVSAAIAGLTKALNLHSGLQFNKASLKVKEIFFDLVCRFNFEVRAVIADKVGIDVANLRQDPGAFYEYLTTTLLQDNEDILLNANLKINKNIDRKFRFVLQKQLQERVLHHKIKKFTWQDQKHDSLIQLVDMITGIISNSYTQDSLVSRQLFDKLVESNKIKHIWKLRESS